MKESENVPKVLFKALLRWGPSLRTQNILHFPAAGDSHTCSQLLINWPFRPCAAVRQCWIVLYVLWSPCLFPLEKDWSGFFCSHSTRGILLFSINPFETMWVVSCLCLGPGQTKPERYWAYVARFPTMYAPVSLFFHFSWISYTVPVYTTKKRVLFFLYLSKLLIDNSYLSKDKNGILPRGTDFSEKIEIAVIYLFIYFTYFSVLHRHA